MTNDEFIGPIEWPVTRLLEVFMPTQVDTSEMWAYCHNWLMPHIRDGRITVLCKELPAISRNTRAESEALRRDLLTVRSPRGNESEDHRILKLIGHRALCSIGAKDAVYEGRVEYGVADVVSDQLGLTVECGNTKPQRVETILYGPHLAMMVIPYSFDGHILAYLFIATQSGREYGAACCAAQQAREVQALKRFYEQMAARMQTAI